MRTGSYARLSAGVTMLGAQAHVPAIARHLSPLRTGPELPHSLPLAQLHSEPTKAPSFPAQGGSPHAPSLHVRKMLPQWP